MKIVFVRHGETDHNVERRIQGHRDTPLNARGEQQAKDIATPLKEKIKIDVIYSSDLSRAYKTAQIISNGQIPTISLEKLRERHMGELEGMLHADAIQKRNMDGRPSLLHYGENEVASSSRSLAAYDELVEESKKKGYETIVIVSHGSALNHLFQALVKSNRVGFVDSQVRSLFYKRPKLGNCSISIIENDQFTTIGEQWTQSIIRERDLV